MKPGLNRRNINFALHNPSTVLRLVAGRLNYEKTLQARVSRDLGFIRSHALKEGTERNFVGLSQDEIDKKLRLITPAKTESSWRLLNKWLAFLYTVTRAVRPTTIIETGVLYGHSSASILAGLEDNHDGRLISVDLPAQEHRTIIIGRRHIQVGIDSKEFSVGCAVPISLRSRWTLRLGNSLELLPEILDETGPISIFIHDSLHTYDHMMAEFQLGYSSLEPGGLLISDDIGYNLDWQDFCKLKKEHWKALSMGSESTDKFGFLIKSSH